VALIVCLLLWILKAKNLVDYSLQAIRQIIQASLLEKKSIEDIFKPPPIDRRHMNAGLFEAVL
jgi:hypothetical protein